MSQAFAPHLDLTRSVALARLGARRLVAASALPPRPSHIAFADTEPLLFRSEAFAEDVLDVALPRDAKRAHKSRDSQIMAAGAAVLRLTLDALKLKRW